MDLPAVRVPKKRVSGRPWNAIVMASAELAVLLSIRMATGAGGDRTGPSCRVSETVSRPAGIAGSGLAVLIKPGHVSVGGYE